MTDINPDIQDNRTTPERSLNGARPKRSLRGRMILLFGLILLAIAVAVFFYASSSYSGGDIRINVAGSASRTEFREMLTSQLGTYGARVYNIWRLMGGEDPHGSYVVKQDMSALRAARMFAGHRQTPVRLTFNNLRTVDQLSSRIGRALEIDSADFAEVLKDSEIFPGYDHFTLPAAFLPDTYEVYWTVSASDLARMLRESRDNFWNSERTAKAKSLGLSPVQVATLASIVEEETSKSDERPLVARLYMNRLAKGMKLQADPTVKFGVGDFSLRRIRGSHIGVDSPYNTYRINGLPPGPIRIVEKSTIDAVLNAPQHSYIYMCAKSDFSGYHDFASDYAKHMENAKRYRNALDRRGIR